MKQRTITLNNAIISICSGETFFPADETRLLRPVQHETRVVAVITPRSHANQVGAVGGV